MTCDVMNIDLIEGLCFLIGIMIPKVLFQLVFLGLELRRRQVLDGLGQICTDSLDIFLVEGLFLSPGLQRHF
jgi:hypothetical protein